MKHAILNNMAYADFTHVPNDRARGIESVARIFKPEITLTGVKPTHGDTPHMHIHDEITK